MTRPTKGNDERLNAHFPAIRITESERVQLEAKAATVGKSLTEYGRAQILGQPIIIHVPTTAPCAQAVAALNSVGVNLNQLTRRANASGHVPERLTAVLDLVEESVKKLFPEWQK